ncbi:hypothetical protein BH23BAC3_BH23BAC3_20990 [soil metagenome]
MFTVGDSEVRTERRVGIYSTIGLSWEIAEFEFTGEGVSPENRADFQNSIIRLRFENPGLHISTGFGGSFTGMDDRGYVNINARIYNDLALIRSPRFIFALPVQLTTDLKSVTINQSNDRFQQSSLVIGTGASLRYRVNHRVDMSLRATPNIGFSFSQGALFGGRLFTTKSAARLYFNEIIGSNSLVFGYDFDFRDYNIEGNENDYRFLSHSFTLGIAF